MRRARRPRGPRYSPRCRARGGDRAGSVVRCWRRLLAGNGPAPRCSPPRTHGQSPPWRGGRDVKSPAVARDAGRLGRRAGAAAGRRPVSSPAAPASGRAPRSGIRCAPGGTRGTPVAVAVDRTRCAAAIALPRPSRCRAGRAHAVDSRAGETWRRRAGPLDGAGRADPRLGPLQTICTCARRAAGGTAPSCAWRRPSRPSSPSSPSPRAILPTSTGPDEVVLPGADYARAPGGHGAAEKGLASVPLAAAAWTGRARRGRSGERRAVSRDALPCARAARAARAHRGGGRAVRRRAAPGRRAIVPDSAPVVTVPVPARHDVAAVAAPAPRDRRARRPRALASERRELRLSRRAKWVRRARLGSTVNGLGDRAIVQGELNALQARPAPGDTLRFRVEAWDNAPAPLVGGSREYALRLPSARSCGRLCARRRARLPPRRSPWGAQRS